MVMKEFVLPREGVSRNAEEIRLWLAHHAT